MFKGMPERESELDERELHVPETCASCFPSISLLNGFLLFWRRAFSSPSPFSSSYFLIASSAALVLLCACKKSCVCWKRYSNEGKNRRASRNGGERRRDANMSRHFGCKWAFDAANAAPTDSRYRGSTVSGISHSDADWNGKSRQQCSLVCDSNGNRTLLRGPRTGQPSTERRIRAAHIDAREIGVTKRRKKQIKCINYYPRGELRRCDPILN